MVRSSRPLSARALVVGALLGGLCVARSAQAQNFAPVASASASATEVSVGQSVTFSSAGSLDPDDGPNPLSFSWDLGDGTVTTDPDVTHAYAASGYYGVTLTASDGDRQATALLEVAVLDPPTPERPARSAPILVTPDGSEVWVVNTDSSSVSVIDTADDAVTEIPVAPRPRSLALDATTGELFVAGESGTLSVIDTSARSVSRERALGIALHGVVVLPNAAGVAVTDEATGRVHLLDATGNTELGTVDVGGSPRALAAPSDGNRLFVAHFLTRGAEGRVSAIDLGTLAVTTIGLVENPGPDTATSGAGFPNLLGVLAVEPSGKRLWAGGLKANTNRGAYLSGEPLVARNRLRGLFVPIDIASETESVVRRIDTNDADRVSGAAFSPDGRYAYLVHQGAGTLSVYDLIVATVHDSSDGNTVPFDARIDVGEAPRGVALSPDGTRAYVHAYLSREIWVVDVVDPKAPSVIDRIAVTEEGLSPRLANGKRLFFRSREPVHSDQNYIACASCHPDGGMDGRTWDFTQFGEGLRNTIDLRGRAGTAHGPVHWSANFDEIQDFENDIVGGFDGTGLLGDGLEPHPPLGEPNTGRSADLDDLALYVASLGNYPRSPHRSSDGSLTEAALRGRTVFFEGSRGCTGCHLPPTFTASSLDDVTSALYDVGTLTEASGQRLGEPLPGIDTPTVLGVWATGPYLHDGSAATLHEVLVERNPGDAHGVTSDLDAGGVDDLVAYLLSLDGSDDEIPDGWVPPPLPEAPADAGAGGADAGAPTNTTAGGSADGGIPDLPKKETPNGGCSCRVACPSDRGHDAWKFWLSLAVCGLRSSRKRGASDQVVEKRPSAHPQSV